MFSSFGSGQIGELLGLAVELDERGLVHVAEPQIAVLVGAQRQEAGREAGLVLGHRKFGDLAGLGIEPAEVLLAEVRVPGHAVLIDDHVVRLRWCRAAGRIR